MPPSIQNSQNHPPFLPPPPPKYFMSNTQIPSTLNSQSSQKFLSILTNSPTMVSNDDVGSQFSQFSIQIGLDEIVIDKIGGSSTKGKP